MATISAHLLKNIISDQREEESIPLNYYHRSAEKKLEPLVKSKEVTVIMGVRRCGKSVLMHSVRVKAKEQDYYFNFEDDRLATFTNDDFQLLYEVFLELYGEQNTFYFDEIQNIPGWEMFVRRLYNGGNKIIITGSNATLFSEELGTRLTGRYMDISIYPFSFYEFVHYEDSNLLDQKNLSTKQTSKIKQLFNKYCIYGGIPEYVKNHQIDYLHTLYESILYRDIVSRYKLPNAIALKKLVFFLSSNCSKETTYVALQKLLGLGSSTTVSDYCSYLENSYLCFFLNRYSLSVKAQLLSPKKVYFVDHALAKILGFYFSDDYGRVLENIAFIELKRRYKAIYYHKAEKECDFLVQEGIKIIKAIQVCQTLFDPNTKKREIDGLLEALESYNLKEGYILTESEEGNETTIKGNKKYQIHILPLWKWLLT
ncbi:ATP-binding protein [Coxiella burnetii]|uniref:ATP-binding protein n=1 Tax=Coxiella burnetii TaxID=777 RepID=UPI0000DAE9E4|nr:ATP-binding protein [Coxiella burnetii]ABX78338.1 putative ATP-binding protein [Coxiella burnetii RSA 331]AML49510.1 ATP-binding protein [Coxiella burnetii]AML55423.1 ATP-binding protein [Coxiella burnetii]ATN69402.1 ATP-binding protein [Coxiella burnetii]ATN71319.1 ATP-binding protein [Coxiella burnetii]